MDLTRKPSMAPDRKFTQADLIAWSYAERQRRAALRGSLEKGAWVRLDDETEAQIGDRVAAVACRAGSMCTIVRLLGKPTVHDVDAKHLSGVAAFGDPVKVPHGDSNICGVVVLPYPGHDQLLAFTIPWERDAPTQALAKTTDGAVTLAEVSIASKRPQIKSNPRLAQASGSERPVGCFVRYAHPPVAGNDKPTIGPHLTEEAFNSLAAWTEPCLPRTHADGRVVEAAFASGDGEAVLCDFAGGATLWVWRSCLVDNETGSAPVWTWSSTWGKHPHVDKICMGDPTPAEQVNALTADIPHQPPSIALTDSNNPKAPALPASGDTVDLITDITRVSRPRRGDLFILTTLYKDRFDRARAALEQRWGGERLAECGALDELQELYLHADAAEASCVYRVVRVSDVELPDDKTMTTAIVENVAAEAVRRYVVVGLLAPIGSVQLAVPEKAGNVVARTAKAALSKGGEVARDAVGAVKDLAVDTGKRKLQAGVDVVTQETVMAVHGTARDTVGAFVGEALGRPELAQSVVFREGFDMAAVFAGRLVARAASKSGAHTVAGALSAGADSLERGLDRKKAEAVVDAVKPVVAGGMRALMQAAVDRFVPALAPPPAAAAPAIPETAGPSGAGPAPSDDAPAKQPRARKSRKAAAKDGGAQ